MDRAHRFTLDVFKFVGRLALFCLILMSGLASTEHRADGSVPKPGDRLGVYRNTHYYVSSESAYSSEPKTVWILKMDGSRIVKVSSRFKRAVDIEGTGKLIDGRVINYAGVVNGEVRYAVTSHPWGRGVGDCPLIPFHTVAVDRNEIPLGSLVYISQTAGMLLPDGSTHDGLWRAEDVGGAIRKDRIDLFVGEASGGRVLRGAGIDHLEGLTVTLVSNPPDRGCVDETPREAD